VILNNLYEFSQLDMNDEGQVKDISALKISSKSGRKKIKIVNSRKGSSSKLKSVKKSKEVVEIPAKINVPINDDLQEAKPKNSLLGKLVQKQLVKEAVSSDGKAFWSNFGHF
jgi:hypothetical protein